MLESSVYLGTSIRDWNDRQLDWQSNSCHREITTHLLCARIDTRRYFDNEFLLLVWPNEDKSNARTSIKNSWHV